MNIALVMGATKASDVAGSIASTFLLLLMIVVLGLIYVFFVRPRNQSGTAAFTLQPDEWVVIKASSGTSRKRGGIDLLGSGTIKSIGSSLLSNSGSTKSIVLTNRNIIVVAFGSALQAKANVDYLPIHQIRVIDGRPSVRVESDGVTWDLEVYFSDAREIFKFQDEDECRIWAENLNMIVNRQFDGLITELVQRKQGVSGLSETLRGAIGAFKSTLGSKQTPPEPMRVAGKCSACGAPITGYSGSSISCGYCDSYQKL